MTPDLTLVEKLATRFAVGIAPGQPARQGDFVTIRPKHVMTHDNTGAVMPKFKQLGAKGILDPRQPVFAIDHDIQNVTPENLGKYAKIEQFAREHGIDFYPAGTGISHQVMVEQGYVVPGSMVVGSDSHSNLYGAMCCLGTPVVRTDAAAIWATGTTWWQVPAVARCVLSGRLRSGVVGKDVIVALCGLFNHDEVLNHAVEFVGEGVAGLTIDQRMSIANMTTEWGALAGVFPFDEVLRDYLLSRAEYFSRGRRPGTRRADSLGGYTRAEVEGWWEKQIAKRKGQSANEEEAGGREVGRLEFGRLEADAHARYAAELELDLSTVIPHVSGPNDVKTMHALPEIEARRVAINKAWLMSCVNARYEDLAQAAGIMRGKKVATGVEFYLAAASAEVQARAQRDGHWASLVEAGAIALPPGCGTCIGLGLGTIKAGEVGISATNRNFEGRMGDRNGQVYLGSPAVVAASAIAGHICSPTRFEAMRARGTFKRIPPPPLSGGAAKGATGVAVIEGFPAVVRGRLWFLDRDNLNTDGIYAGKHTYNDKMTPSEMAAVIFENYDPAFRSWAKRGDIVVGGLNFGTGSSREQAATALKHFGVPCVIAASFSETYKRNAFNNGFVVFECPGLVEWLRGDEGTMGRRDEGKNEPGASAPGANAPGASATGVSAAKSRLVGEIEIDYQRSVLTLRGADGRPREFAFPALSPVAQELVVAGGAEEVVKRRLK
ncbi:MAG: aconitase family protein [Phycisphaerales bacterium]